MSIDTEWLEAHLLKRALTKPEQSILQHLEEIQVDAHETIIKEGKACSGLMILRRGKVRISIHNDENIHVAEAEEGALFCKKSLVDPASLSTAYIVATRPCTLYKFSHTQFVQMLNEQPELAFHFLSTIISYQEDAGHKQERQFVPMLLNLARIIRKLPLMVKLIPVIFILLYILSLFTIPSRI